MAAGGPAAYGVIDAAGRARRASHAVFALNGVLFAAVAARIPDLKRTLDLTAGELGITLLAVSVGSLVGLPSSGWVTHRFGAARAVGSGIGCAGVGVVVAGAGVDLFASRPGVMAGLVLTGLGVGVWDVGMNLEGTAVERVLGHPIMPRLHASFSGGTVASAVVGSGLSALDVPVAGHLGGIAVLVAVAGGYAVRAYLPSPPARGAAADAPDPAGAPASLGALDAWRDGPTLLVGLVMLVSAITEGTANDWLSVAMVEGHGLPPWAAVLGFATFLAAMTLGRVGGAVALARHGRVPVLRVLFAFAAAGALLVVAGSAALAFLGAAAWGLGASLGFPVGFSAAADDPPRAPARISVVSTIGYLGFLAGPPLLGFVGDRVGVLRALLVVGVLAVVAFVAVPAVREPPGRRP